jgi:low affinity Fe/Cu permease
VKNSSLFTRFANWTATQAGKPYTFTTAVLVVIGWACSGPLFHFSDTWQLVINTGTTIITFLMVFLIQNTQNRDGMALQAKLDELIHAMGSANNAMLDLEELDEETLGRLHNHYCRVAKQARDKLEDLLDKYEQENDREEAEAKDRSPAARPE